MKLIDALLLKNFLKAWLVCFFSLVSLYIVIDLFTHLDSFVNRPGGFPAIAGYSGTKSAVDRMTRVAAMEAGKLGYGVRVNCLYPGLVPTDMGMQLANDIVAAGLAADAGAAVASVVEQTPLGRLGEVGDMADAAVFLCSNEARFITGAGLPVDGGMGM